MGEGGGTAHSRVHSIARVSRQRLPSKAFLKRLGCLFNQSPAPALYLDVGARQAPGKYRLAPSSISAGILLSRGWGPGANYSCAVLPQPKEGHLVRSYGPVVDKPLRGGDWTGVLSSNDACGLSHSHPKWWPDSFGLAWSGRDSHRDYSYPGIDFYVS